MFLHTSLPTGRVSNIEPEFFVYIEVGPKPCSENKLCPGTCKARPR
jgi:hypothetical protein